MATTKPGDTAFTGSVAQLYEQYLVPLIFEPYAVDIARRVAAAGPRDVLEMAAGTGVVTRHLAVMLEPGAKIVATDLNPAMIAEASRIPTARDVEWQVVDATNPPFADASFDAVVCQFGAMFFPDRPAAYAHVRRMLKPGGLFAFSAWTGIEESEFAACVSKALAKVFPDDPPNFMARTPHGYSDPARIEADVMKAGFAKPTIERIAFTSRAASPRIVATAYCQGTPWRGEIEARDPANGLERATRASEEALSAQFGPGEVEGQIAALVVTATA